jgi:2'-5' RNA ligase
MASKADLAMSSLEVVATPVFASKDRDWLVRLRETHAKSLGPPHFTLVFPGSELEPHDFAQHVAAASAGLHRIAFRLRAAVVAPDPQVRCFHVFLVPDEGFAAIIRLHERLHAGPLDACLSPNFPYIPHLTVASERDFAPARRLAASLNAKDLDIAGRLDELEIHRRDGEVVRTIAKVPLAKGGLFG